MKRIITSFILLIGILASLNAQFPPSVYHNYNQMKAIMDSLATAYPNLARVDSIGVSSQEQIPIWAIKISNNVSVDKDVPRILLIGDIHSEEIIGQEMLLANMKEILQKRNLQPYIRWLNMLEIWFVPCMNPEGLNVVFSGVDATYRKNKRDTNNNGVLDFAQGQGGDIDGVDLNRNFPSYWEHGDSLLAPGSYEVFDYYRGAYPASEGETQAIINLMRKYQFIYSIVWHSSRTGNLAEKVYPPYNFKDVRPAPDLDINQTIGQGVASQILKQAGPGNYESVPSLGRYGASNIWAYVELGCIQLTVECGTMNIQPDSLLLYDTITRCSEGTKWLLNRALSSGNDGITRSMLTGHIKDAQTQQPLKAEISIAGRNSKEIKPRYSDEQYGRFWRPLLPGNYVVTISKKGYVSQTVNITVNSSGWATLEIQLIPKTSFALRGSISSNGQPLAGAKVYIPQAEPEIIYTNAEGIFETTGFDLNNTVQIRTLSGLAIQKEISLDQIRPTFIHFNLSQGNILLQYQLNNTTDLTTNFSIEGPWNIVHNNDNHWLTDSSQGYGFYAPGCNVWIKTINPVSLPSGDGFDLFLNFDQKLFTEWYHDYVFVEISTDNTNWTTLYTESGEYYYWHTIALSLNDYKGQTVYFRFRLKDGLDQDTYLVELTDPGWDIDNLMIHKQTINIVSNEDETLLKPVALLKGNYPNPFNPETKISFDIRNMTVKSAQINIFNVKGQKVKSIPLNDTDVKNGFVLWKGNNVSSGVYFYHLNVNGKISTTKKAVLLK